MDQVFSAFSLSLLKSSPVFSTGSNPLVAKVVKPDRSMIEIMSANVRIRLIFRPKVVKKILVNLEIFEEGKENVEEL